MTYVLLDSGFPEDFNGFQGEEPIHGRARVPGAGFVHDRPRHDSGAVTNRRSGAAERVSMAQHRPRPRRTFDRRRRRERPAARGIFRRRRRRPLENDGCRQQLGARYRRPDQLVLGGRGRGVGVESRRCVHRHGRVVHPRQHHAGRRRLQVERRRQDMGAHRLQERRCHLEDSHPSHQPGHRLRRGLRPLLRSERRARRVQDHGRRQDLEAHAVQGSADRRRRHRAGCQQSKRSLRRLVGGVPHRIPDVERRPGQWHVQVDGRRRHMVRNHAQPRPTCRRRRPHRPRQYQGGFEPCLCPRRKRKRRPLCV